MLGFSLVMQPAEIRALRARQGWTQNDLADRLGTDAVTVSRWERGKSLPRPSAQVRLKQLQSDLPSEIQALVLLAGAATAKRVLRRSLLLRRQLRKQRFSADPTRRIKEVERALREQVELKDRARFMR